jgi:putative endonuclease
MMVSDQRRQRGRQAEDMACAALQKQGYGICDRNFWRAQGEIDIIAEKDGCLYFVEVRSKSGTYFGTAAESVNINKKRQIYRIAEIYLAEKNWQKECGFLVVAVDFADGKLEIIEDMLT